MLLIYAALTIFYGSPLLHLADALPATVPLWCWHFHLQNNRSKGNKVLLRLLWIVLDNTMSKRDQNEQWCPLFDFTDKNISVQAAQTPPLLKKNLRAKACLSQFRALQVPQALTTAQYRVQLLVFKAKSTELLLYGSRLALLWYLMNSKAH